MFLQWLGRNCDSIYFMDKKWITVNEEKEIILNVNSNISPYTLQSASFETMSENFQYRLLCDEYHVPICCYVYGT